MKEEAFAKSIGEIIRVSKKYILINSPFNDSINWPVSNCDKCGNEFNVYGHLRKIDENLLKTLFPEAGFKVLMKKAVGLRRDIRPGFLVFLARFLNYNGYNNLMIKILTIVKTGAVYSYKQRIKTNLN